MAFADFGNELPSSAASGYPRPVETIAITQGGGTLLGQIEGESKPYAPRRMA